MMVSEDTGLGFLELGPRVIGGDDKISAADAESLT